MGIHDETIRKILEEKEEEIALLELAFPEESKSLFNLDSVQYEKDSFVPDAESENRFDLLLSVEDLEGNKRRIYFLFEHKSYESDLVYLDFLRYVSLAYKKHLTHENQDLGPILPILLIQTEDPWNPPTLPELLGFSEGEKESFEKFLPSLDIRVINLHKGFLEKLDLSIFLHFILYVMHYIRHDDFLEFIDEALQEVGKFHFQEDSKGIDKFRLFVHYLNKARRNARREDMAQLIERNLSEKESLEYMTIAERERYEGKIEGREEGKLEGKVEKALETARLMIEYGDSIDKISKITGLTSTQLKENGII